MRQLQLLESGSDKNYDGIPGFFERNGMTKTFYAPSAAVVVQGTCPQGRYIAHCTAYRVTL